MFNLGGIVILKVFLGIIVFKINDSIGNDKFNMIYFMFLVIFVDGVVIIFVGSFLILYFIRGMFQKDVIRMVLVFLLLFFDGVYVVECDEQSGIFIRYWCFFIGIEVWYYYRWDIFFGVKVMENLFGVCING